MTRKDYVALADAFANTLRYGGTTVNNTDETKRAFRIGVWQAIEDVAVALKQDNPRFDKDKFIEYIETKAKKA